jgi:N-acetylneuraminic acid mutarotase
MNRFDFELNDWIPVTSSPTIQLNGIGFSLKGKIYYGLTSIGYVYPGQFWVYDRKNGWIERNNFPVALSANALASFSIDDIGYVLFADSRFYKYDPDTDNWTRLADFPGPYTLYGMISFEMAGKGYVGLGVDFNVTFSDIWSYDPVNNTWDTWAQRAVVPGGGRKNSIAFSIGNKAYLGFGYAGVSNINPLNDFFEYDLDYPVK